VREGIFGKYNVEVTGIKLGGILQDFVRQSFYRCAAVMLPRPQAEKTLSACRLRYRFPLLLTAGKVIYLK